MLITWMDGIWVFKKQNHLQFAINKVFLVIRRKKNRAIRNAVAGNQPMSLNPCIADGREHEIVKNVFLVKRIDPGGRRVKSRFRTGDVATFITKESA